MVRWQLSWMVAALVLLSGFLSTAPTAQAEVPYERRSATVLIVETGFGPGFARRQVLLMQLLEQFFTVRVMQRGQPDSQQAFPSIGEPVQEISRATLAGTDVLVLLSWGGMSVGTPEGMQQVTNNLTAAEMDTLTDWLADGGSLLVIRQAVGRADENNLPELLSRFGLTFRHQDGLLSQSPAPTALRTPTAGTSPPTVDAHGHLSGHDYRLVLPGWIWPMETGTPILTATLGMRSGNEIRETADQLVVGAIAQHNQGQVAFLGNGDFFEHRSMFFEHVLGAFDQAENVIFLIDLLNHLAGQPLLSPAEREYLAWDVKLVALSASVAQSDIMNYRSRTPEGSDFAHAKGLLHAAERGERCDIGPGCVPFHIDEETRAHLERAAQLTDETETALDRAEHALPEREYASVDQEYREALERAEQALALTKPLRQQTMPIQDTDPTMLLIGLGSLAGFGLLVFGVRRVLQSAE